MGFKVSKPKPSAREMLLQRAREAAERGPDPAALLEKELRRRRLTAATLAGEAPARSDVLAPGPVDRLRRALLGG